MKPDQFRALREQRKLTREELAQQLGISASAIVQWERGTRTIPAWAIEKMLSNVQVTLPLDDLALLLEECTRQGLKFEQYLARLIQDHLKSNSPTAPPPPSRSTYSLKPISSPRLNEPEP